MTTLILVCLSTIGTIVEKVADVKSNKDKATRLGKKCEGWKVILAELQEQKAELPKTAEVNIMAIRDALERADKLIDKCMKKKIFGSAAQTRQFLEVDADISQAISSLSSVAVSQGVEAKRIMEATQREVQQLRQFMEKAKSSQRGPTESPRDGVIPFSDLYFNPDKDNIGAGAQGQVYVGRWRTRPVAIKKLTSGSTGLRGAQLLQMGSRELSKLRVAAQTCRNVVKIYGVSHDDADLYLVMQLLEQSLESVVDAVQSDDYDDNTPRVGLDLARLLRLGEDLFRGLSDLHSLSPPMAHCDIKPANVLLDERGEAHLVDFGLAHSAMNTNAAGSMIASSQGTCAYMSPESFEEGELNVMRDVWAAAATLCHAASGVMPFAGLTMMQVMRAVCDGHKAPEVVRDVFPAEVEGMLRRAFAFDPADRPTAEDLMKAFVHARSELEDGKAAAFERLAKELEEMKMQQKIVSRVQGLLEASEKGETERVRVLLKQGADMDEARNTDGATALYIACGKGHLEIVRLLVEAGADKDKANNTDGATPLLIASQKGYLEIGRLLVDAGADKDKADKDGWTPFFMASQNGYIEIVRLLVDAVAEKDKANELGQTPLFIACERLHLEIVRLLVDAGADKDKADNDGRTPLWKVCREGHLKIVLLLIEAGADKDKAKNTDGATPLYVASQEGHLEIVRLLIEKGADKDKAIHDGRTPLWMASQNGHLEIVRLLVEAGTDKDKARNTDGVTPMFIASRNSHLEIVRLLIEKGADKNKAMNGGETPLFMASQEGQLEVVRLLVEKGADKNKARKGGSTPLDMARRMGHSAVVALLERAGATS